jgi:hypothetical protein
MPYRQAMRVMQLLFPTSGRDNHVTLCCCPLILLAVSIDNASGKMAVKLIHQGLARKLRRLAMLRFGNEKAMSCPLILLAR